MEIEETFLKESKKIEVAEDEMKILNLKFHGDLTIEIGATGIIFIVGCSFHVSNSIMICVLC